LFLGNGATEAEKHPQRKKERAASKKVYSYLTQSYIVRLCCDYCIEDQPVTNGDFVASGRSNYYVRVREGHTECLDNKLVLQEKESNLKEDFSWIRIRACPPGFKPTSDICESFLSGESCRQRNRCPFPHSTVEKELWTKYFSHTKNGTSSSISMDGFIDDLRNSLLRVRCEVEQMWQKLKNLPAAELKEICQECWKKGNGGEITEKRPHAPECQNGHRWDNKSKKMVLDIGNEKVIDLDTKSCNDEDWTDEMRIAVEAVHECRKRLSNLKVTDKELITEVKRLKQQQISTVEQKQKQSLFGEQTEGFFNDDDSTSGSCIYPNMTVDDESEIDVEEDPTLIYDDDLEDTRTVCSNDFDSSDDEAYAEDPYYQLNSVAEARDLLKLQPNEYKRCTIHLDGPFSAKCRMLDEGFQVPRVPEAEEASTNSENDDVIIREVEIRGRANCGPCFDGDEVVVKLRKTKELDGDKIIYRGTVIAVLAKKILRKAYTLVCRVDTYQSHLMKPLDGIAPKVHVVNSILKKKYCDRKDELVAEYAMVDGSLKLRKIIKLDPRQRRDMLFVVKYVPLILFRKHLAALFVFNFCNVKCYW